MIIIIGSVCLAVIVSIVFGSVFSTYARRRSIKALERAVRESVAEVNVGKVAVVMPVVESVVVVVEAVEEVIEATVESEFAEEEATVVTEKVVEKESVVVVKRKPGRPKKEPVPGIMGRPTKLSKFRKRRSNSDIKNDAKETI